MSYDLQGYKIQTFPNINDAPVAPTSTKAGNGSHLIKQHNNLIDEVEGGLNSIESFAQDLTDPIRYNFARGTYNASPGEKIMFFQSFDIPVPTSIDLYLFSNPQIGDWVEIVKFTDNYRINLYNYLGRFNYQSYWSSVYIPQAIVDTVTLIYCGNDDGGWIPTKQNIFTTTTQSS